MDFMPNSWWTPHQYIAWLTTWVPMKQRVMLKVIFLSKGGVTLDEDEVEFNRKNPIKYDLDYIKD